MRLKLFLKKKKEALRLLLVVLALSVFSLALRRPNSALVIVSDVFFAAGVVYLVVGMTRYIRNVGLFKTFSYMAYKRRWKRANGRNGEFHPMSLAEYTQNVIYDEMRQRPAGWPLALGCGCWVVSLLLAMTV